MATRIAVISSAPHDPRHVPAAAQADLLLDTTSEHANVLATVATVLGPTPHDLPPLARDLMDVAVAIYISDLAVRRGELDEWTRDIALLVPVREVRLSLIHI